MDKELAEKILKKTQEDYNLIIKDSSRGNFRPWPELFANFQDYIRKEDKVLDIGCGVGRFLDSINQKDIDYIGIDSSDGQLQEASKRHPSHKFLLANAIDLPFTNNSFDKVFLISLLHHIPGKNLQKKVIEEAIRVLKSGGFIFISVWRPGFWTILKKIIEYGFLKLIGKSKLDWLDVMISWGEKTKRYYHLFREKELTDLVLNQELKIVKKGLANSKIGQRKNLYLIYQKS